MEAHQQKLGCGWTRHKPFYSIPEQHDASRQRPEFTDKVDLKEQKTTKRYFYARHHTANLPPRKGMKKSMKKGMT
jgi:hypothetical protein